MRVETQRLFPPFLLDIANAQLWRQDQKIPLRPKTFEVLCYLTDHPGRLVTKAALLDAVWAGLSVSDSMPAICVAELRKALADELKAPHFIETVHRRGYRFLAQITPVPFQIPIRGRPRQSESLSPIMVGREEELAQLRKFYSRIRHGQRLIVFIAGEAGIGKTTLARAFLDSIADEDSARIGIGQCVELYGAGEPYRPVLEVLSRLTAENGGERVREILNNFAPTWLGQMPELLTQEERARLLAEVQAVTQQRMLREMTQALEELSAGSPLVLLFEDLHWSDVSTLELISAVARRREAAQLLVLATYRSDEILAADSLLGKIKYELELHHLCEDLPLKPLSRKHIEDYLSKRLARGVLRRFDTLAPVIESRAEGNPLFMVNMVDYLIREGGVGVSSRQASEIEWVEKLHVHRFDAMRSVSQMIERNLERLPPEEQTVLEAASVAGMEFSAAAVAAALDSPQHEIEAHCARLSRREQFLSGQEPIKWPDGTIASGFRFRHALYQDVLYGRLTVSHRMQLHERIAQRQEAGYGERVSEIAIELAHHYTRTNDQKKAIQYFRLAGDRAAMRGSTVDVESHYLHALALLRDAEPSTERDQHELDLLLTLGPALIAVRGYASPEVERTYNRARELCGRGNDTQQFFSALYGQWMVYLNRGEFGKVRDLAEHLLQLADTIHESTLLLYAHYAFGNAAFWIGDFTSANDHLGKAVSLYNPERYGPLPFRYFTVNAKVMCLSYIAWTLWHVGYPDQARSAIEESLALSQRLPHKLTRGLAEISATMLHLLRRETHEVQLGAERVISLSAEQGLNDFHSWATALLGWAKAELGHTQEGIELMQEGLAANRATGSVLLRPHLMGLLAQAYSKAGRVDDEKRALTESLASGADLRIQHYEAETYRLKGESLLRQNGLDVAQAQECFERAIEIARRQGAKSWELRATTSLARTLHKQGKDARKMLGGIYEWFKEGFETVDLREAKALLVELDYNPTTS
jgi:DNA-binding winged helix-turn-helix (wHTH) protein/predicted ATPase